MLSLHGPDFEFNDIELIIFDKDGTLTDSHFFWLEIIKRRAFEICKFFQIEDNMNSILQEAMGADLGMKRLSPKGPVAIEGRDKVVEAIIEILIQKNIFIKKDELLNVLKKVHNDFGKDADQFILPINSACQFIKELKSPSLKLALITSDSFRNANIALKKINLLNKFDLILGGDSNCGSKKSGEPAKYACNKLGIPPSKTITIGDAEMDLIMSRNANLMGSILVATGQISLQKLKSFSTISVESLNKISIVQ